MKNRKKEKEFRKQVRIAVEMINFVKKKELPVKASVSYETVPAWGKTNKE
jgi:hypothetical protein|tara:strand:+ start:777 stop:926 length:150 start_codon:yes stop_codon:yes gene_type:complete